METYRSSRKKYLRGFTILEVLVAITVMAIGLCALAALAAQTVTGTERARYMGLATILASEKLEDLNRWPNVDPHVAAGGSLTADSTVGTLNYFDDIDLSNTNGQVTESVYSTTGGVTTYTTVIHKATGETISPSNTAPPTGSGVVGFHRRWLIEADPTVNGITLTGSRRATVVVSLANQVGDPLTFQMSLVRP
jgi:prepilin-type N-terminal cleavage/methylation domain-containing protein